MKHVSPAFEKLDKQTGALTLLLRCFRDERTGEWTPVAILAADFGQSNYYRSRNLLVGYGLIVVEEGHRLKVSLTPKGRELAECLEKMNSILN